MELQLDFFEVNERQTSKKKKSDPVKANLLADKLGLPEKLIRNPEEQQQIILVELESQQL